MAISPLDSSSTPGTPDRGLGRGHGTRALGPSDSSDSGSDMVGVGPEVGDANLDSDSDRNGTGETAAAGRDTLAADGADIGTDRIETMPDDDDEDEKEKDARK